MQIHLGLVRDCEFPVLLPGRQCWPAQERLVVHIFTWAEKIAGREIELVMSKEKGNAIISSDSGHSNIKVAMRKKSPSGIN